MYIVIISLLVIIIAFVGWFVTTYNKLLKNSMSVKNAYADMNAYLKKRWDLVPNLVEVVKKYASHEKETLTAVVEARTKAISLPDGEERDQAENMLTQSLGKLIALQEAYPDLKAESQFTNLSNQLDQIEKDILNARRYYNAVVTRFNTEIKLFPAVLIAKKLGFTEEKLFEIQEEEKQAVKVKF